MRVYITKWPLEYGEIREAPPPPNSSFVLATIVFDFGLEDTPSLISVWPQNVPWFEVEYENDGLVSMLRRDHGWVTWMLHEGVAPGQQFIVRIWEPKYTRDYLGEHDVDFEVVQREPLSDALAWRAWAGAFFDKGGKVLKLVL
jgi:hypothetical protein